MKPDEPYCVLALSESLYDDDMLTGLPGSVALPRLRGPALETVVNVLVDGVAVTSGLATIAVAWDDLSEFVSRLGAYIRRKAGSSDEDVRLRFSVDSRELSVVVKAVNPNEDVVQALRDLLNSVAFDS